MAPRADFACLSKKCDTPEGASVYELPVGSKRCPVCGSKRIRHLFNSINVATGRAPDSFNGRDTSSSMAARTDALAEPAMIEAIRKRDEVAYAARHYPMVKPVPMRQLGGALQQVYSGHAGAPGVDVSALEKKADLGGSQHPVVAAAQGMSVRESTIVAATDKEYRLVRGKDGLEVAKA